MAVQREYLSPNEVAEVLGVSPFTIRRYIKLGELRAVKLLGGFRVHRDHLQRFLKAHEVNPSEEDLSPEEFETTFVSPLAATQTAVTPHALPMETIAPIAKKPGGKKARNAPPLRKSQDRDPKATFSLRKKAEAKPRRS